MSDLLNAIRVSDVKAVRAGMPSAGRDLCAEAVKLAARVGEESVFDIVVEVAAVKVAWTLRDALREAVRGGHIPIVEKLIARGARDREWRGSCAGDAALLGDLSLLRALDGARPVWSPERIDGFDAWPDEDVVAYRDGDWPLFNAIRTGNVEVVAFLLGKGAYVNRTTSAGRNPVEMARALGHAEVAALLEDKGGVAFDRSTVTFSQSVFYGFWDEFLERVDAEDATTRGYAFRTAASMGHMRFIHALAPYGTPKQLSEGAGYAAAQGNLTALNAIISLGANLNGKDSLGRTPLIWAAANNRVAALRILVKAGAKLDGKGGDRQTALETAIFEGRVEAAAFLLAAGANPNTTAGDGSSPLSLAKASPHRASLLPLLASAGARADHRKEVLKGLKKKLSKEKRKAYRLEPATEPAGPLGTKLGGQPYLTADHPRPEGAHGPLSLLLQVDLRAHPDKKQRQDALLQVFVGPTEGRSAQARLVPAPTLASHQPDAGPERQEIALGFSRTKSDFASHPSDVRAPLDEDEEALLKFLNLGGDKLGGWPDWVQDPHRLEGEQLLLQLVDGGLSRCDFGDAGNLFVFEGPKGVRVTTQSY